MTETLKSLPKHVILANPRTLAHKSGQTFPVVGKDDSLGMKGYDCKVSKEAIVWFAESSLVEDPEW